MLMSSRMSLLVCWKLSAPLNFDSGIIFNSMGIEVKRPFSLNKFKIELLEILKPFNFKFIKRSVEIHSWFVNQKIYLIKQDNERK